MSRYYEREEEIIQQQYDRGEITLAEYNQAIRDLQREEESDRQERAENAFRNEYNNW